MNFRELLIKAKAGDEASVVQIFEMYKALLLKASILQGRFDEDMYQDLCVTLLKCIKQFKI